MSFVVVGIALGVARFRLGLGFLALLGPRGLGGGNGECENWEVRLRVGS